MTCTIAVQSHPDSDPLQFTVTLGEEASSTQHEVTMAKAFADRFPVNPEALVAAALRFLLDREVKESILPRFDLAVIRRYFPDFEQRLPEYLAHRR